jgi:hypothetical protein
MIKLFVFQLFAVGICGSPFRVTGDKPPVTGWARDGAGRNGRSARLFQGQPPKLVQGRAGDTQHPPGQPGPPGPATPSGAGHR